MTVEIIAECGLNHLGKLDIAKKMVEAACVADVDVVKFQTYTPDAIVYKNDKNYKTLKELALSRKDFINLAKFCKSMKIEFLSTPGDVDSLKFLVEEVGVRRIKIGSDDLTYQPLVWAAIQTGLPLILSTGMATIGEIQKAVNLAKKYSSGCTLLHCVSLYPCPIELANLKAIDELRRFGYSVGYSDHVAGYWAAVYSTVLGVSIIEKHFMLKEHDNCVDKEVSINEYQLTDLVRHVRYTEQALGDGLKYPSPEEAANIEWFRKDINGKRKIQGDNTGSDTSKGRIAETAP